MARSRRDLRVAVVGAGAVLAGLLLPPAARANIGPRWWGDLAGEPPGVNEVAITREQLTIDLRPLAAVEPARVEVLYHLHNPGGRKKLNLLFVSGAPDVQDFEVRLGDRRVPSKLVSWDEWAAQGRQIPDSWKPPSKLPGIRGGEVYSWIHGLIGEDPRPVSFSVELPPGGSTLRVRYRARAAGTDQDSHPTATWVFPYMLAPAGEWGSFGALEVAVYIPEGWEHHSEPALEREGTVLRGRFTGLPANILSVAVRAPVGREYERAGYWAIALYVTAMIGGGFLCWLAGRRAGRFLGRRIRPGSERGTWLIVVMVPVAALLAVGWAALILGAGYLSMRGVYNALAGQESPYFHERYFGAFCGTALLILIVLPTGFYLAWRGASRALARLGSGEAIAGTTGLPGGGRL